jgi:hypothetical protein
MREHKDIRFDFMAPPTVADMLKELSIHYDEGYSVIIRELIRERYKKIFGIDTPNHTHSLGKD